MQKTSFTLERRRLEQACKGSWPGSVKAPFGVGSTGTPSAPGNIFPRDPGFLRKAGRILYLCERVGEGNLAKMTGSLYPPMKKTSIQARRRRHAAYPTQPGSPMKAGFEYTRCGAWA